MASDIIVIERELLKSEAFRELNGTAKTVYFDFRMKVVGTHTKARQGRKKEFVILNNGEIEYSYSEAEKKGIQRSTFMRAIDTLIHNGLIDCTQQGSGTRKGDKSKYGISERWKNYGKLSFNAVVRKRDTRQGRGFAKGHKCYYKKQT